MGLKEGDRLKYIRFVMVQGILGAFAVRVPVSFIMRKWEPVSLFFYRTGNTMFNNSSDNAVLWMLFLYDEKAI